MLSAADLSELLHLHTPACGLVSLYLPADQRRSHIRAFANLMRQCPAEDPSLTEASEDLRRIDEFVGAGFEAAGWRGLAVFSSKRLGLWRVCPLPEPVKPALRLSDRPYLAPLLSIADQCQRFGVLLAGPERARFLEVFMGQVQEYPELDLDLRGLGPAQARGAAERLDGLARDRGFGRIVLGATSATVSRLAGHLRTELQQNLIIDESLTPETPAASVLERIRSCEGEARKVRESVLAHRLIDLSASGGPAVLGLERTLQALRRGQVRLLLARDGFAKMGHRCPRCADLSLAYTRCPTCNGPAEIVFNIVDEMIERALQAHCEVVRLLNASPLDNLGHIGAELSDGAATPEAGSAARTTAREGRR